MIYLSSLIKKRDDISKEDFDEYGPLAGQQPRYDGIAQFWVEKEDDLIAVFSSDYYRTIVATDEMKFIKESCFELYVGEFQVKWDKEHLTKQ
ncbi:hypothetical protein E8E12_001995 [Didymella heteroderae]|uniref:EthD domain-containing protein n=1 Tax=Didymella heteroderae TaxID=1769908 RepID=A0A9P4WMR7_9PLEO|nr:hypothetical protein E8E12_001995 [Didymella heteroderae]